jgi:hypothetical protein
MRIPKKQKEITKKTILVNDKSTLAKQFYQSYNPNYWFYKITSLKNLHDNYSQIKSFMTVGFDKTELGELITRSIKKC